MKPINGYHAYKIGQGDVMPASRVEGPKCELPSLTFPSPPFEYREKSHTIYTRSTRPDDSLAFASSIPSIHSITW